MPNHQKNILFWGPQCAYAWLPAFVLPAFEALNSHGWKTTYFFPPLNEFGSGVPLNWHNDPEITKYDPDIRVINDPLCSTYHINNDDRAANALHEEFKDQSPDVIVTRTHGHGYLKKLFPDAVILSMADAIGTPWYGRGVAVFTLTEDEFFYGNSLLSRYPDLALDLNVPDDIAEECWRLMNTHEQLAGNDKNSIDELFGDLRRKYRKLYTIPGCAGVAETNYNYYAYDHQYITHADIIYHFLANSEEDEALIVTSHPFTPKPDVQTGLMKIFADVDRVIIADELDISPKVFTTGNIMPSCDGMICWLSKAYWHALICGKPLLDVATHDIAFCKPYKDIQEWRSAERPQITPDEVMKLFYWFVTRYRIRVQDTAKLDKILTNFVSRSPEKSGRNQTSSVYEWADEEQYYQRHFLECIDQIRVERGL